jgi:hypothetical protein
MSRRTTIALVAGAVAVVAVIAAAVGIAALGRHGPSESSSTSSSPPTSSPAQATPTPAANKYDVRVYNISTQAGLAGRTADQLKAGGFNATVDGNLFLLNVTVTTVYFSNAPGERDTASAVGRLLGAPVEPRIPEVADQPPGVIVVVTG